MGEAAVRPRHLQERALAQVFREHRWRSMEQPAPLFRPVHLPRVERTPHGHRAAHDLRDRLHVATDVAELPAGYATEDGSVGTQVLLASEGARGPIVP